MPLSDFHESMEGWVPAPTSLENAQPPIANPATQVTAFLRTTLPLPMQYSGDTVKQYIRPGLSSIRTSPVSPNGMPTIVSAAASTIRSILSSTTSTIVSGPDDDTPIINENVQTGTAYTVQLSDRDTLISMTNNAGGTVTLPGQSTTFGYVQTVAAIHAVTDFINVPLNVSVGIINTLGNAMIVVIECSDALTVPLFDTNANTYTLVCSVSGIYMYYATNIKGGSNALSFASTNTSNGEVNITAHEFSGILPGGLDSNGIAIGAASLTVHFPNTVAVGFFRNEFGDVSNSGASHNPSWNGLPPVGPLAFNTGSPFFAQWYTSTVDQYLLNPPLGTLVVSAPGTSGGFGCTAANFKTSSIISTVMPKGWYTYIENTGTGVFTVQSTANIDGANQSIALQPNTGVLIVSDGVGYWSERGVAASVLLETNGTPNSSQTVFNAVSGTGITVTDIGGGSVRFASTAGTSPYVMGGFIPGAYGASQDLMAIPVDRVVSFVANFGVNTDGSQSEATLQTAATASTVFIINKIVAGTPTQIGTITFAVAGTVGTFASTGGTAKSLNAGDVMQILAPASPDATAAFLGFTLSGTR